MGIRGKWTRAATAAAAGGVGLLATTATASAAVESAKSASALRDAIGVNMQTGVTATGDGSWDVQLPINLLAKRVDDLGIKHVRGNLCASSGCTDLQNQATQSRMVTLSQYPAASAPNVTPAPTPIRWLIGAGSFSSRQTVAPADRGRWTVTGVTSGLAPFVEAFEGVNEPPEVRSTSPLWASISSTELARVTEAHNALYAAAREACSPTKPICFPSTPVLSPPAATPNVTTAFAGLASKVDIGAWHVYRDIETPDRSAVAPFGDQQNLVLRTKPNDTDFETCAIGTTRYFSVNDCNAAVFGAGKPAWLTEMGYRSCPYYTTNGGWTRVQFGVTEDLNAAWTPRAVLDAFRLGYPRFYLYALTDYQPPNNCTLHAQQGWGLIRANATGDPKPSYNALKRTLDVIGDAGLTPVAGTQTGLDLKINDAAGVAIPAARQRHLLLKRANGTYVLALWATDGFRAANGVPNNNWGTSAAEPAPPAVLSGIKVGVNGGSWNVTEYRPFSGAAAVQTAPQEVTTQLNWDVRLFDIRPR